MARFHPSFRILDSDDANYTAEAELVQERAQRREPSVIRLGPIVFFSTATGDAWMLDHNDGEAACLARAGEREPIPVEESAIRFIMAWQARYRIEGDTFTVIEPDGRTRVIAGYPTAMIQRLIDDYPAKTSPGFFKLGALEARLRNTGRNDSCPCQSGKKYKKCCQSRDEAVLREAKAAGENRQVRRIEGEVETREENEASIRDDAVIDLDEAQEVEDSGRDAIDRDEREAPSPLPAFAEAREEAPALAPEVAQALAKLWDAFDQLKQPSTSQMDEHLDALLVLPPDATSWSELFNDFAHKNHADLPGVFRRIAAAVPPTKAAGLSYFYWGALEKFATRGRPDLIAEIVAGFCTLDRESYDADALRHMELWLLAAGAEGEMLALTEHFLPILRAGELLPHAVPETCRLIFEVRVGRRLRDFGAPALDVTALASELRRDVAEEIHADYAQRAARVICAGEPAGPFKREDFDLADSKVRDGQSSWAAALDRFEALMHVAREAWQSEGRPPGCVFRGLWLLVDSIYDARDDRKTKGGSATLNLLDALHTTGMERRIAQSARGIMGTNPPHALLLLEAHADLRRFAVRHALIDAAFAAKSEANVAMLKRKMGFAV